MGSLRHSRQGCLRDHDNPVTDNLRMHRGAWRIEIPLYSADTLVYRMSIMKLLSVLGRIVATGMVLVLSGCTTTSIHNLTPSRYPRHQDGLYLFQVEWQSNQQSLRKDTLKPYVVIGTESYPLQRTPMLQNRWEAMVPLPAEQPVVNYRFKFDYEYLSIPARRPNSKLSAPYQLQIQPK